MGADIATHYELLHRESVEKILAGGVIPDPYIDDPLDCRYGLTLLCRPSLKVWQKVEAFLNTLYIYKSKQYFYRYQDAHVTVMPIISCEEGFSLDQVNLNEYYALLHKSLTGITPFSIRYVGLILSPSAVLIKGYPEDIQLNRIRENLRREFGKSNLKQSLDKRYLLKTAHSTVIRFTHSLNDIPFFLEQIEQAKFIPFGSFEVRQLEFVFNDWYQRYEKVKTLRTFALHENEER